MATITSLRSQKEPTALDNIRAQFSLPPYVSLKQDITAVLTLEGQEESYVSPLSPGGTTRRIRPHNASNPAGWQALPVPAVPLLSVSRQEIRKVHYTSVYCAARRAAQFKSWCLRSQHNRVAWNEDRKCLIPPRLVYSTR